MQARINGQKERKNENSPLLLFLFSILRFFPRRIISLDKAFPWAAPSRAASRNISAKVSIYNYTLAPTLITESVAHRARVDFVKNL